MELEFLQAGKEGADKPHSLLSPDQSSSEAHTPSMSGAQDGKPVCQLQSQHSEFINQ